MPNISTQTIARFLQAQSLARALGHVLTSPELANAESEEARWVFLLAKLHGAGFFLARSNEIGPTDPPPGRASEPSQG